MAYVKDMNFFLNRLNFVGFLVYLLVGHFDLYSFVYRVNLFLSFTSEDVTGLLKSVIVLTDLCFSGLDDLFCSCLSFVNWDILELYLQLGDWTCLNLVSFTVIVSYLCGYFIRQYVNVVLTCVIVM